MIACITVLIVGTIITPVFATRYINLEKKVDVRKELFAETLTDLRNYAKIFPSFIKSVELKSDNNAKFRVNVEGTSYDAEVRYTIQPDYKYVLEVVSGDLKGTKMITTLTETWGFDGTPNAGTIVNMKVTLETSWFVSFIMFFVGDHQIRSALDTGVYLLAEHAKKLPVQVSSQNIETKNIEAARKLEPEKEALKSKSPVVEQPVVKTPIIEQPVTEHEHATMNVIIFGDKFDFSSPTYQVKNRYIQFENHDGDTIHRHASGVTLSYFFQTLKIGFTDSCFVFPDKREFCTNDQYSLKFFINHKQVPSIQDYVLEGGDMILISYGNKNSAEIASPPITVATDRVSYADGETIVVFGKVSEYVPNVQATIVITNPIGQRVYLAQIEVGTDKTYSTEITAGGSLWKNAGTYTMIIQYGFTQQAETTFSFSGSTGDSSVNTIKVEGTDFSVSYIITNGMVTAMKANPQSLSLIISIQTTGDRHITLTLPRALIDAKTTTGEDDEFFVLIDKAEVSFKETKSATSRTLSIGFLKGDSTIEIIGTHVTTH